MASNITVYDLTLYPDNNKTVIVDLKTVVPIGYEGDEQWVLSFATNAYSDNTNSTAIQDIYTMGIAGGWLKSSGFPSARFTLVSGTNYQLKVKMDASAGATGQGGYYVVTLTPGTNMSGDTVAADLETKIRAIPDSTSWNSSDSGYDLSYRNAVVNFEDNRLWIISGSTSTYYTGASRSSVAVAQYITDTAYSTLGFNLSISSETVANRNASEALVTTNYTADSDTLVIETGTGVVAGDCMYITDGSYSDYFQVITVSGTTLTVPTIANNGFTGISNNYTADITKVQRLDWQDPDVAPKPYYTTVDSLVRHGIMSISNQIDFSS